MKKLLLAAFLSVFMFGAAQAEDARAVIGQPAPDFTATDTKGNAQSITAYKGKIVVLEWTNPECPYVKKHYESSNMQNTQKAALDSGAIWLRVNSAAAGKQGHQTPAEFDATATDVTANIIDESGAIGHLYDAKTTPHMFVIDQAGTLVYAGGIDDKATSDPVDIASAKNYVTAALADLKAGRPVEVSQSKPYGCGVKYAD